MRAMIDMQTIQIEVTNRCHNACANCTRLCGHHMKPYVMDVPTFKKAVDSLRGLPKTCLVGVMGGEPLLSPHFREYCEYLQTKFPKEQCGLWTCLPPGKEEYREVICTTFGNIFINDHTRSDILHSPVLVASKELNLPDWQKDHLIDKCWVQNTWSASINPKGAWFCEVAGALAMLLDVKNLGWNVEEGWWLRSPKHFIKQMAMCDFCGCAMPLKRRCSTDGVDDISPDMYHVLKDVSPKLIKKKYAISDCQPYYGTEGELATYKDFSYRDAIAKKYGIFLTPNEQNYQSPHLMRKWQKEETHGA